MMSMPRKALFLMALMLAAATAATAATAFAGTVIKYPHAGKQVSETVNSHANTVLRAKVSSLRLQTFSTVSFRVPAFRR